MNEVFNFSRFIKYARCQASAHSKKLLLVLGGISIAFFLFLSFIMSQTKQWGANDWLPTFLITSIISVLLLVGNSFSQLRKKESTMNLLLLPSSTAEKFIYEFLVKVVFFTIAYLILFFTIARIAPYLVKFIKPNRAIQPFDFEIIISEFKGSLIYLIACIYFFGASLAFAGAAALKKLPLIKVLLFVGVVMGLLFCYFWLAFEKLDLNQGFRYVIEGTISDEKKAISWGICTLVFSSLTALFYGFFKLKEREV